LGFGRTKLIRQGSQSAARPARLDCHVHKINGAMTRSELKFNSMSGCQAACILPHCSPAAQLRRWSSIPSKSLGVSTRCHVRPECTTWVPNLHRVVQFQQLQIRMCRMFRSTSSPWYFTTRSCSGEPVRHPRCADGKPCAELLVFIGFPISFVRIGSTSTILSSCCFAIRSSTAAHLSNTMLNKYMKCA